MKYNQYTFSSAIWLYPGHAGWHFITVPSDISDDITSLFSDKAQGWGSIPVEVTLGTTTWQTSIFPDKKTHSFLLPLKKAVRVKEAVKAGDTVQLVLEIIVKRVS